MIIGSNNLFRSSIYNSAGRIYSYICGLVEIICYRMLTSLDFYYVILHVTVIYFILQPIDIMDSFSPKINVIL